ncbi:MAG TPA: hypothetical protein VFA45_19450 [Actinomycetes bacterium]|nr:hypothetical protein [Actinomycetes bacterium]
MVSGSVNTTATLVVEAARVGQETFLAQVARGLGDQVRAEAAEVIAQLRRRRIEPVLVSGDTPPPPTSPASSASSGCAAGSCPAARPT